MGSGETKVESHASSETQPKKAALPFNTVRIQPGGPNPDDARPIVRRPMDLPVAERLGSNPESPVAQLALWCSTLDHDDANLRLIFSLQNKEYGSKIDTSLARHVE
jgi:hypothetical protein